MKISLWGTSGIELKQQSLEMNLNVAMFTQKKNVVIVLQDFIAVEDVLPIHIISMALSQMRMILGVNFRRSVSSVQL